MSLLLPGEATAGEENLTIFGFAKGNSAGGAADGFEQYQVSLSSPLPWRWRHRYGTSIGTRIEASLNVLTSRGEESLLAWIGPSLALSTPEERVSLEAGFSPALLSEERFGAQDLGGTLQFVSFAGLSIALGRHLFLGIRFQHISNAGLYDSNPGVNVTMIGLSYRVDNGDAPP